MHAVGRLILAPRLLPLLLAAWLAAPSGPKGGLLFFDSLVHEEALTRGAWPAVLSAVLTAITRASLPALLLELADAADGTAAQDPLGLRSRVPSSECVGASVAGAKLVFEGRVNAVQGQPPLAYTLRTGVSCRRSALGLDGVTRLASECSSLCWEEPELRLSLGETGLAGMLPKLWLHVQRAQTKRPPSLSSLSLLEAPQRAAPACLTGLACWLRVPPPCTPEEQPLRLEPTRRPRHGHQPRPALESPQCVRLQAGGRRGRGTAAAQRTSHARVRLRGGGRPACERHDPAGRIGRGERRRPGHRDPVITVHSLGVMPGGRALHPPDITGGVEATCPGHWWARCCWWPR